MGIVVLAIVLAIIGVLTGWLAPIVVKSRRPYGMSGDLIASVVVVVVVGLIEWLWIMPALNFTGWIKLAGSIGDPFALALIVLWLMRKIKGPEPAGR